MSAAARIGDPHTCPVCDSQPHVGGPLLGPGAPTVLIGGRAAAVAGGGCRCEGPPDRIAGGSASVLAEDRPLARLGDPTGHGGVIVGGEPSVEVG